MRNINSVFVMKILLRAFVIILRMDLELSCMAHLQYSGISLNVLPIHYDLFMPSYTFNVLKSRVILPKNSKFHARKTTAREPEMVIRASVKLWDIYFYGFGG